MVGVGRRVNGLAPEPMQMPPTVLPVHTMTRLPRYMPLLAGLVAFATYGWTTARDLTWAHYGGDGGELITAVFTLGVPHPPGYPTYVLLGNLFSQLPLGTVAHRMNLFSAVSVAVAVGFVSSTVAHQLSALHPPSHSSANGHGARDTSYYSLAAGLCLAFAPLVWGQATIAEVYGLNLAFVAAFVWSLLTKRPFGLTGFLLGLSITTHLTSGLLLPMALIFTPRSRWFRLIVGLLAGLLPFLVLPFLAKGHSPVVWGDPTTLAGWWWLVSGRLYQPNLLNQTTAGLSTRLIEWAWVLGRQFTWAGLPLIAWGVREQVGKWASGQAAQGEPSLTIDHSPLTIDNFSRFTPSPAISGCNHSFILLGTAVLYLLYAFLYNTPNAVVYTLPGWLLLSLLLAPALQKLGKPALLLPFILLLVNFPTQNLSHDDTIRPSALHLLQTIPANTLLETSGENTTFALWYFHYVEGHRPDVILVDANLLAFDWYRARLQQHYPDLQGLRVDNLDNFRALNEKKRPYCITKDVLQLAFCVGEQLR